MGSYQTLKRLWHALGFKGHINNYSSKPLWVVVGTGKTAVAYLLPPMTKTPPDVDADGFRRVDGIAIEGHKSWWKIYSGSTAEIFDNANDLKVSIIKKTPVNDSEFTRDKVIYEKSGNWAVPIKLIDDVKRNKKKRITKYHVTEVGWLDPEAALSMTCSGEIANARPVFPSTGKPYIRTKRDRELFNNIEVKG